MKRILVALDGSKRSTVVLTVAARLATLANAKLVLFRAINIPTEMTQEILAATTGMEDLLTRKAYEDLSAMAKTLPEGLIETITTDIASPWDGIVRAGRTHDVDLIVLGSHGYGGIDHLLGTTAAKVANHADRNVFIVRTLL